MAESKPIDPSTGPSIDPSTRSGQGLRPCILYMEDNPGLARLFKKKLERAGYLVDLAGDGEEGLAMYAAGAYDVVAVDHTMPQREGLEVIRVLASQGAVPPVVMVTGTGNEQIAVEAMKLGARDYVVKDVEGGYLELLPTVIERVLREQRLVEEKQQALEALRQSEARYRGLFDRVPVGLYRSTPEGQILAANPALVEMLGYPDREVLLAVNAADLYVDAEDRKRLQNLLEGEGVVRDFETQMCRRDGAVIWVRESARVVRGVQGLVHHYEGSVQDITQRKRAEQEREKLIEELDAFAHTVAHDLKAPLNNVIGFAKLLAEKYDTLPEGTVRDGLHYIAQDGLKMNNIVEELMLLAGVRKGEAEMRPLDMASIVGEAQRRLAYMIEEYQAQIILPEAWPIALGYDPWVEEVWANYLSNAIKYGGQPPRVELGGRVRSDGMVCFWVRDNGLGLNPDQQARLFTPFERLDQVRAEGHGLGLSVVRRIVEKLGGQVGVESEVGQGSVFTFTLPSMDGESDQRLSVVASQR